MLAAAQPHQHCRGLLIQRPLLEVILSVKYYLVPQSCFDSWYNVCFSCCHCFAMASTCCNPLLYCWLNQNFRWWYQPPLNIPHCNSPQPGGELGLCGDDGEVRPPVLALPPLGPGSGHQNCSADAAQPAPARTGGHRQHQLCVRYFLDILRYFLDI